MVSKNQPNTTYIFLYCFVILAATVSAQDISQYYTVQHADKFDLDFKNDLYGRADKLTKAARDKFPHHLDMAFGEHPKQRLDIYLPQGNIQNAPVLMFLHGGGFQEGDRSHYGFISIPYTSKGIITVSAGYRLTSDGFHYPSQADDLKNAIIWLYRNIAVYGGNPEAIFVSGHSAGAMLAANVGADVSWLKAHGIPTSIIRGIVPVSGRYDLTILDYKAYVPTAELRMQASALYHVNDPVPVAIVSVGTPETQYLDPSRLLHKKFLNNGVKTKLIEMENANHIDTVIALGTEGSILSNAVLEMINGNSTAVTLHHKTGPF